STINTLTNSGTITAINTGVSISSASIQTFTNEKLISSDGSSAIFTDNQSTIENFTNNGTIKSNGNADVSDGASGALYSSSGLVLKRNTTINTLTNRGSISGKVGINIVGSTIGNLNNTGTIQSTSSSAKGGAIIISNYYGSASTIENFTNEGTIQSSSNGILVEVSNKIGTLTNKGTIDAKLNGISFFSVDELGNTTNIGKITIESAGVIKAGNDAIHIDGSDRDIEGEGIDVKGRLEGGNAGIY
ncbi:hypothetical protein JG677_08440, partial [Campylobacter sp. TTU-622]|nr:hypothetical protein [Campylobacter sp. TTU-622]